MTKRYSKDELVEELGKQLGAWVYQSDMERSLDQMGDICKALIKLAITTTVSTGCPVLVVPAVFAEQMAEVCQEAFTGVPGLMYQGPMPQA